MTSRPTSLLITAALVAAAGVGPSVAGAQDRRVIARFTPTKRVSYAIWITSADGARFATVRLTNAVGRLGIGNRPGATQMNSGFRWPYGRREGVLPIWAHARLASGATPFRRVIFQDRPEGWASRVPGIEDSSQDGYFCLSFTAGDEALDTVSCASPFFSDKGRWITADDVAGGYAEPFEMAPEDGLMMPLLLESAYPPRRDMSGTCSPGPGCYNHPDVFAINVEAVRAMPEIDRVTRATPMANVPYEVDFAVPPDWPDGDYVLWLEANTEGDYAPSYGPDEYPTPAMPDGEWDSWAIRNGYPYRGQPSVVFRVPIRIQTAGDLQAVSDPAGYSDVHGRDGAIRPLDGTIVDDPVSRPGSGADRLLAGSRSTRLEVEMRRCDEAPPPMTVTDVVVSRHDDIRHAHQWAHLALTVPASTRALRGFEVRVSTEEIVDEGSFMRAEPARAATLEGEDLVIPARGLAPGDRVEVDFGGLLPEAHYFVAVRAVDACGAGGPFAVGEVTTSAIHFTTVAPCFVATAAYGTPLATEIRGLRRFRDRHLAATAPGRALIALYGRVGPPLARTIDGDDDLRAAARTALAPAVLLADWLDRAQ